MDEVYLVIDYLVDYDEKPIILGAATTKEAAREWAKQWADENERMVENLAIRTVAMVEPDPDYRWIEDDEEAR